MQCLFCEKEIGNERIIDDRGREFCTEDCLDDFYEATDDGLDDHPYLEDYRAIRAEFLKLEGIWGNRLEIVEQKEFEADDILDDIDEIVTQYGDHIMVEGSDGPYSWEIYQYVKRFRQLQKEILTWRPTRLTYHVFDSYVFDHKHSDDIQRELNEKDKEFHKKLFYNIRPYRDGLGYHFVFDYDFDLENAVQFMRETLEKYECEFYTYEAFRCEGGCGDVVDVRDVRKEHGGWVYCTTCEEKYPFILSSEELTAEIERVESERYELDDIINERRDWCYWYKRQIRRSFLVGHMI